MKKLGLIVGAALRGRLRWAKEHLYVWLILSPLVLGMAYATAARLASNAPEWRTPFGFGVGLAAMIEICLIAASLSRASGEIYHLRSAESFLEAMPLGLATHLHVALASRVARVALVGIVILLARSVWIDDSGDDPLPLSVWAGLCLFVLITALAELLAALNWIHWWHTGDVRAAAGAIVALLPTMILAALLLALIAKPGEEPSATGSTTLLAGSCLWTIALYAVLRILHVRWRASDIEYAKRLQTGSRWSVFDVRALRRRLSSSVAAQLARDLQLTVRAFSSAVYVALAFAGLSVAALATILATGVLPPPADEPALFEATWLASVIAIKVACVVVVASLVLLVPVLTAHQATYLWLERTCGASGIDLWRAKVYYARIISLPAPFIVWATGLAAGDVPFSYTLLLFAECLWLWWIISTLAGALAFEMPNQPGLAMIVMAFVSLGVGLSGAWLWPFGVAGYGMAIHPLRERGYERARYYLLTEGD